MEKAQQRICGGVESVAALRIKDKSLVATCDGGVAVTGASPGFSKWDGLFSPLS